MHFSDMGLRGERDHAVLDAQIRDARHDICEWRSIVRSNEEALYVEEMDECLAALQGIVEARRSGVELTGEEGDWGRFVDGLLEAYNNVGEVRGQRFGWGLCRLTSRFMEAMQPAGEFSEWKANDPEVSRIGRNIGRLKKECGWTYDDLSARTGIDRKQTISHVQGRARPRPGTLKLYSQAFTKELGRQITPVDLEK